MSLRDLIDVSRLADFEADLWEEYCRDAPDEAHGLRLYEFGHICMLEGSGIPDVVAEKYNEFDSAGMIAQYLRNVSDARSRGEL